MANQQGFISDNQMLQMEQQQPTPVDYSKQQGFISDVEMKDQARPKYANGLSEITPINQSPITAWDRTRMSMGQVGGSMSGTISELKKMGYEVKRNKQNDIVLKDPKDGLWKMYDAKDAWSASRSIWENIKEMGADVAEIVPDVAAGAVQQAVALPFEGAAVISTFASGGTATPAAIAMVIGGQAAGAVAATAAKTVMGKLAGTYESNPEEDFADLQRETLLNLGGGLVGVGVVPTAKVIGGQLAKLGKNLPSFDDATKSGLAKIFGTTTGVGEDAMQYGFKDGFTAIGDDLARFKNLPSGAIKDELKKNQVDLLADTAPEAFKVLRSVGKKEEQAVLDAAASYAGEVVSIEGRSITQSGLAGLEPFLQFNVKGTTNPIDLSNSLKLGLDGVDINLKSNSQLVNEIGLNLSSKARSGLEDFVGLVMKYKDVTKSGKDGAKWSMSTIRNLKNSIDSLDNQLMADGVTELKPFIRQLKENLDNSLVEPLNKLTNKRYDQYLLNYKNAATQLEPYTAAVSASKSSNNRMVAYETLVNKMNSRAGSNVYAKGTGDELTKLAALYEPGLVSKITSNLERAELHAVSSKFADWTRPGLIGQSSATIGLGGILSMNPAMLISAGAGAAASSPKLAMKVTPAMLKAAQQVKAITSGAGRKLSNISKTNPIILQQLLETPFQVGQQEDSIKQQLGNAIQQGGIR